MTLEQNGTSSDIIRDLDSMEPPQEESSVSDDHGKEEIYGKEEKYLRRSQRIRNAPQKLDL